MKTKVGVWLFFVFVGLVTPAVLAGEPEAFAELKKLIGQDGTGWGFENDKQAAAFNVERDRLGGKFMPQLLSLIGSNPDSHYWCGEFLASNRYCQGRQPMSLLAIALWEQGVILEREKPKPSNDQLRSLNELLAIECAKEGLHALASYHKAQAEYLAENGASGPATNEDDTKIYESIPLKQRAARPSSSDAK
jgi:hypothetical protein